MSPLPAPLFDSEHRTKPTNSVMLGLDPGIHAVQRTPSPPSGRSLAASMVKPDAASARVTHKQQAKRIHPQAAS